MGMWKQILMSRKTSSRTREENAKAKRTTAQGFNIENFRYEPTPIQQAMFERCKNPRLH